MSSTTRTYDLRSGEDAITLIVRGDSIVSIENGNPNFWAEVGDALTIADREGGITGRAYVRFHGTRPALDPESDTLIGVAISVGNEHGYKDFPATSVSLVRGLEEAIHALDNIDALVVPPQDRFNNDLICSLREALRPEATDSDFRDVVDHLIAVMTARGLVEVEDIQNLPTEISELDDRISALEDEDLHNRLSVTESRIEDLDGYAEDHDLEDLENRISSLENEDLDDRLQALEDVETTTFESRISDLEDAINPDDRCASESECEATKQEVASLRAYNAVLADRISELECAINPDDRCASESECEAIRQEVEALADMVKVLTTSNEHLSALLRAATERHVAFRAEVAEMIDAAPARRWWQFWK